MIDLAWGRATSAGRRRAHNEDALLADPPVFVVADGMGGHAAGEVASELAVQCLRGLAGRTVQAPSEVSDALARANREIHSLASGDPDKSGMGTTAVGLVAVEQSGTTFWLAFNLGDSRIYRFHGAVLTQVTVDHSYVQELVDGGLLDPAAAREHPERAVVTRALGTDRTLDPDYWILSPEPGERFLLCSDGLTSELTDDAILAVLSRVVDPAEAADALVDAALEAGGRDNVTVLVVDVPAAGLPESGGVDGETLDRTSGWNLTSGRDLRTGDDAPAAVAGLIVEVPGVH